MEHKQLRVAQLPDQGGSKQIISYHLHWVKQIPDGGLLKKKLKMKLDLGAALLHWVLENLYSSPMMPSHLTKSQKNPTGL